MFFALFIPFTLIYYVLLLINYSSFSYLSINLLNSKDVLIPNYTNFYTFYSKEVFEPISFITSFILEAYLNISWLSIEVFIAISCF